jgi:hypothetical protein
MPTHLDHHIPYEDTPRRRRGDRMDRRGSPVPLALVFAIALTVTLLIMFMRSIHAW